jgi:shikimate dehydrogenase
VQEEVVKRLGVLGWPVAHSRSPAMQNAALASLGLRDWSYQRLPVPPALFAQTVRALAQSGFVGANVTIPHKRAALALADSASAVAQAIGAANTLTLAADGTIAAENTDAPGLLDAIGQSPAGKRALVLGAGGSARAVVHALRAAGADVAVWNRSPERARLLAADLGVRAVDAPEPAEVLVNCTSVGLRDPSATFKDLPVSADDLRTYACVVDLVYREGGTGLLLEAERRGCRVVDGLEILVRQGARSFQIWTGRSAPLDVMRRAARGVSPLPELPASPTGRRGDRGRP